MTTTATLSRTRTEARINGDPSDSDDDTPSFTPQSSVEKFGFDCLEEGLKTAATRLDNEVKLARQRLEDRKDHKCRFRHKVRGLRIGRRCPKLKEEDGYCKDHLKMLKNEPKRKERAREIKLFFQMMKADKASVNSSPLDFSFPSIPTDALDATPPPTATPPTATPPPPPAARPPLPTRPPPIRQRRRIVVPVRPDPMDTGEDVDITDDGLDRLCSQTNDELEERVEQERSFSQS